MRRGRLIALACVAVLAAGCASPAGVSWRPQPLRIAMEPNAYRAYEVMLRAGGTVDALELIPSPGLRSVLSVAPGTVERAAAGSTRAIRLAFLLPPTSEPGRRITGTLEPGLRITIDVVPPTAEGTLESLRRALEQGEETPYVAQFVPGRQEAERRIFRALTDTARLALAQTLQTAERTSRAGDTAEYGIYLLLGQQRVPSSIVLRRGRDGVWRVARF